MCCHRPVVEDRPLQSATPHSANSEITSSAGRPKKRRPGRPRRTDGQDYDTDYNSSGDELDDDDFDRYENIKCSHQKESGVEALQVGSFLSDFSQSGVSFSEFPPITNEQQRNDYKREFDQDHQEYKDLQAELDAVNKNLSELDNELDQLEEGSPQYLVRRPHTEEDC